MILTNCAACAAPLAHDAPRCVRCKLRYCNAIPATTRRYDYPYIRSLEFLVRCPPEIAWHVLGYWRCQYPVDTQLIDQLGYR